MASHWVVELDKLIPLGVSGLFFAITFTMIGMLVFGRYVFTPMGEPPGIGSKIFGGLLYAWPATLALVCVVVGLPVLGFIVVLIVFFRWRKLRALYGPNDFGQGVDGSGGRPKEYTPNRERGDCGD